jgi:hypothetical protein
MAKPSDTLNAIVATYVLELDTVKIARASINREDASALAGTDFIVLPVADALKALNGTEERLEQMTILALWIVFERHVLDHVMAQVISVASLQPAVFGSRLHERIQTEIEYWRFGDILDLYKDLIDVQTLGRVKQIKQYRDWIAHRNPNKTRPL